MKREELKALELSDEAIDAIMALHGKDVEAHKTAVEASKAEVTGLKAQLKDANTAIEGFKKLDVEGVQKAADEWKAKAEQAEATAKQQVEQLKFDHALDAALSGAKAKNPVAVRALLKVADLKLAEDGKIIGLDDQLKAVRESADYLFEAEGAPPPKIVAGGQPATSIADPLWENMLKGAGLTEPKA